MCVKTPNRGELVIHGEGAQHWSALCSAARVRRYLRQGCSRFMAYVMDAREKDKVIVDDVPIICEYLDVFPKDLPRVPLKRQVEFHINLVPDAASIAKEPYRLVPPEMQELSTQLHELLDKGFI